MKGVYVAKHSGATSSQKIVKTNPFVETKNEHIVKAHLKDSKFSEEKAEVIKNEVIIDQNVSNSSNQENSISNQKNKKNEALLIENQKTVKSSIDKFQQKKNQKKEKRNSLGLIALILTLVVGLLGWAMIFFLGYWALYLGFLFIIPIILSSIAIYRNNKNGIKSSDHKCALAALVLSVFGLVLVIALIIGLMFLFLI